MREEMRGLFLAIVLSIVAIFITNRFFPGKTVPAAAPAVTEEAPLPQTPLPQEKIKADELIAAADTAEIMASAEAVDFKGLFVFFEEEIVETGSFDTDRTGQGSIFDVNA